MRHKYGMGFLKRYIAIKPNVHMFIWNEHFSAKRPRFYTGPQSREGDQGGVRRRVRREILRALSQGVSDGRLP